MVLPDRLLTRLVLLMREPLFLCGLATTPRLPDRIHTRPRFYDNAISCARHASTCCVYVSPVRVSSCSLKNVSIILPRRHCEGTRACHADTCNIVVRRRTISFAETSVQNIPKMMIKIFEPIVGVMYPVIM